MSEPNPLDAATLRQWVKHECPSCDLSDEERSYIQGWNAALKLAETALAEAAAPRPAGLHDGQLFCYGGCGTRYEDFLCDVHLPTALWNRIAIGPPFDETDTSPREGRGGVLCPTCIMQRLAALPGTVSATVDGYEMESGTLAAAPRPVETPQPPDIRRRADGDGWIMELRHEMPGRFTDIDIFDDGEVLMSTGGKDEPARVQSNKPIAPPPPPESRDPIETLDYQARAARERYTHNLPHCREDFPAQPSRWCSGCLIAALLMRLAEAREEEEDTTQLRERMAKLLSGVAVAVNGPEPPLTSWSWHDLPEKVAALRAQVQKLTEKCAAMERNEGAWITPDESARRVQQATDALIAVVRRRPEVGPVFDKWRRLIVDRRLIDADDLLAALRAARSKDSK